MAWAVPCHGMPCRTAYPADLPTRNLHQPYLAHAQPLLPPPVDLHHAQLQAKPALLLQAREVERLHRGGARPDAGRLAWPAQHSDDCTPVDTTTNRNVDQAMLRDSIPCEAGHPCSHLSLPTHKEDQPCASLLDAVRQAAVAAQEGSH